MTFNHENLNVYQRTLAFNARVSGWVREGFLAPRTKQRSSSLRDWIFAWPKVNCREKKSGS